MPPRKVKTVAVAEAAKKAAKAPAAKKAAAPKKAAPAPKKAAPAPKKAAPAPAVPKKASPKATAKHGYRVIFRKHNHPNGARHPTDEVVGTYPTLAAAKEVVHTRLLKLLQGEWLDDYVEYPEGEGKLSDGWEVYAVGGDGEEMWVFTEVDDGLPREGPGQDEDDHVSVDFPSWDRYSGWGDLDVGGIGYGYDLDQDEEEEDVFGAVTLSNWADAPRAAQKKAAPAPKAAPSAGGHKPFRVIRREHDHHNNVKEPEDILVGTYATYAEAREVARTWISDQWDVHVDEREKGTICGGYETYAEMDEGEEFWVFVQEEGTRRLGGPDGTVAPESVFVVVERKGAVEKRVGAVVYDSRAAATAASEAHRAPKGSKVDIVVMKVVYA